MLFTISNMKRDLVQKINCRFQQVKVEMICIFIIMLLFGSVKILGQAIEPAITSDKAYELPKSELSGPNLTPYQPKGWDNVIVVSAVISTHLSTSPLFPTQTLYVDWAAINDGAETITKTFYTRLYVDGVQKYQWYTTGLAAGSFVSVSDYNIGSLTAGSHTIKIVLDATGAIKEDDESDNEYTRTITIYPDVNLAPYQPFGWDNRIVISTITGNNTSSSVFLTTDNIYVDWAALNNGANDITATFYIRLYIDDVSRGAWTKGGLNHNTYTTGVDYNVGKLTTGDHTFKIVVDSEGQVAESDETDNEYSRTITVVNKNLAIYQPSEWDNKIVLSTVSGTNTSPSVIRENETIYLDYSIMNNGSYAVSETFYVRLYIDGVEKATWTKTGLGSNTYYSIQDFVIGTLPAGTHKAKIVADVVNDVNETSEIDNEYTRTFTVATCKNLAPHQPGAWDNKIVLSTVTGTNTSATSVYTDQDIFVDGAVISNGTVNITETFSINLYLDSNLKKTWTKSGLAAGIYLYFLDFNMGNLSAGPHTFKIVADSDNSVPETSETDNEYSRTITIIQRSLNVSPATVSIGHESGSNGTFGITSNTSWTINDDADWLTVSPASGSNNATITVTASSKNTTTTARTALVTITGSGVAEKTVTVTQQGSPTGINDTESDKIRIYPNPVSSTLFIEGLTQITTVSIYDLNGHLLLKKEFADNKIDVAYLSKGIYIIEFEDKSGFITRKFIKQ